MLHGWVLLVLITGTGSVRPDRTKRLERLAERKHAPPSSFGALVTNASGVAAQDDYDPGDDLVEGQALVVADAAVGGEAQDADYYSFTVEAAAPGQGVKPTSPRNDSLPTPAIDTSVLVDGILDDPGVGSALTLVNMTKDGALHWLDEHEDVKSQLKDYAATSGPDKEVLMSRLMERAGQSFGTEATVFESTIMRKNKFTDAPIPAPSPGGSQAHR
eukprot:TRINITY_DN14031_c0_g1_i3.p1 TRINITY_DN14031_c0_g1~~TRINITY_DN14031_c0_g1_i3.p1  ORF type:complete len:216 (+),score=41.59 TRINITY_DN14031_c0_g1_i3:61-708(+)